MAHIPIIYIDYYCYKQIKIKNEAKTYNLLGYIKG